MLRRNCRTYATSKSPAAARRDLEVLRAAIGYWHREYGPLLSIPAVTLPPKPAARDRWLTRSEVARLLGVARHTPHLARFILLGIYSGSRSGALLATQWSWVDLVGGTTLRRAPGTTEDKQKRTPPARLSRRILAHLRRWKRLDSSVNGFVIHYEGKRIQKMRRSWRTA